MGENGITIKHDELCTVRGGKTGEALALNNQGPHASKYDVIVVANTGKHSMAVSFPQCQISEYFH